MEAKNIEEFVTEWCNWVDESNTLHPRFEGHYERLEKLQAEFKQLIKDISITKTWR